MSRPTQIIPVVRLAQIIEQSAEDCYDETGKSVDLAAIVADLRNEIADVEGGEAGWAEATQIATITLRRDGIIA